MSLLECEIITTYDFICHMLYIIYLPRILSNIRVLQFCIVIMISLRLILVHDSVPKAEYLTRNKACLLADRNLLIIQFQLF